MNDLKKQIILKKTDDAIENLQGRFAKLFDDFLILYEHDEILQNTIKNSLIELDSERKELKKRKRIIDDSISSESKGLDLEKGFVTYYLDDHHNFLHKTDKLKIQLLEHMVSQYKLINEVLESRVLAVDSIDKTQQGLIEESGKQISSYQKGLEERKANADAAWSLARKYFDEEISNFPKDLMGARRKAATRAGIKVKDRQLINKLPDPRQKQPN